MARQIAPDEPIRDRHIRAALVEHLRQKDPTAAILHELPLSRGERRADVAYVNGVLAGYEIKSDGDSLARLGGQAQEYATVFEYMTMVVARRHLHAVRQMVPRAWGILLAEPTAEGVVFRHVRQPRKNTGQRRDVLVRLMWKEECVRALRAQGIKVSRQASVIDLWPMLEALPMASLCGYVRDALKGRDGSGSAASRTPGGG
jgi:hypothetical protein